MGILESKHRVVDSVITQEGRRQLASGMMKVEYYSFTDGDAFYQSSSLQSISGLPVTDDVSSRLYFEAVSALPQDQITFESNDAGLLNIFGRDSSLSVVNGQLIHVSSSSISTLVGGLKSQYSVLSGSDFSSTFDGLLTSSIDNFLKLNLIQDKNNFYDEYFSLNSNPYGDDINDVLDIQFSGDNSFIDNSIPTDLNINNLTSLLDDKKLSNSINFKFLPPIVKQPAGVDYSALSAVQIKDAQLGTYQSESSANITYADIENGFDPALKSGYYRGLITTSHFGMSTETSLIYPPQSSKLALQVFEVGAAATLRKLDVLDLGELDTGDPEYPKKRCVFVGKVFKDSIGRDVFLQIFTLVFY
jgi:hypothetical protein